MQDRPTKTTPDLFTPISIGPLALPNRIAMAPLTRSRAAEGSAPRVEVERRRGRVMGGELTRRTDMAAGLGSRKLAPEHRLDLLER